MLDNSQAAVCAARVLPGGRAAARGGPACNTEEEAKGCGDRRKHDGVSETRATQALQRLQHHHACKPCACMGTCSYDSPAEPELAGPAREDKGTMSGFAEAALMFLSKLDTTLPLRADWLRRAGVRCELWDVDGEMGCVMAGG